MMDMDEFDSIMAEFEATMEEFEEIYAAYETEIDEYESIMSTQVSGVEPAGAD